MEMRYCTIANTHTLLAAHAQNEPSVIMHSLKQGNLYRVIPVKIKKSKENIGIRKFGMNRANKKEK